MDRRLVLTIAVGGLLSYLLIHTVGEFVLNAQDVMRRAQPGY